MRKKVWQLGQIFLGTHAVQMVPKRVSMWHWILIRYYSLHLPSILKSAIHLHMLKINLLQNFRLFYIYKAVNPRRMWLVGVPLKNYVSEFLSDKKGVVAQIKDHMPQYFIALAKHICSNENQWEKNCFWLGYFI